MDIKNLEVDHTYLIRFGTQHTLLSITVLMVTETAYHIQWNTNDVHSTWELKDKLGERYNVVEDITSLMAVKSVKQGEMVKPITMVSSKLVNCYVCRGIGTVPDSKSTAGRTTCPACNGAKMIPEIIELT